MGKGEGGRCGRQGVWQVAGGGGGQRWGWAGKGVVVVVKGQVVCVCGGVWWWCVQVWWQVCVAGEFLLLKKMFSCRLSEIEEIERIRDREMREDER